MLLRRVTKHVKDQNWIAVGIDFAIVVIGVFIGLQVANWSETRAQNQRELIYLERLDAEFEIVGNRLNQTIATSELARDSIRNLSQAHDQGEGAFSNGDTKSAVELLVGSVSAVVPARSPAVFNELVSNGELSIIRSADLRTALYEFDNLSDVAFKSWEGSETAVLPFRRLAFEMLDLNLDTIEAEIRAGELALSGELIPNSFFDNSDMQSELTLVFVYALNNSVFAEQQLQLVERIKDLIAKELDR